MHDLLCFLEHQEHLKSTIQTFTGIASRIEGKIITFLQGCYTEGCSAERGTFLEMSQKWEIIRNL